MALFSDAKGKVGNMIRKAKRKKSSKGFGSWDKKKPKKKLTPAQRRQARKNKRDGTEGGDRKPYTGPKLDMSGPIYTAKASSKTKSDATPTKTSRFRSPKMEGYKPRGKPGRSTKPGQAMQRKRREARRKARTGQSSADKGATKRMY